MRVPLLRGTARCDSPEVDHASPSPYRQGDRLWRLEASNALPRCVIPGLPEGQDGGAGTPVLSFREPDRKERLPSERCAGTPTSGSSPQGGGERCGTDVGSCWGDRFLSPKRGCEGWRDPALGPRRPRCGRASGGIESPATLCHPGAAKRNPGPTNPGSTRSCSGGDPECQRGHLGSPARQGRAEVRWRPSQDRSRTAPRFSPEGEETRVTSAGSGRRCRAAPDRGSARRPWARSGRR